MNNFSNLPSRSAKSSHEPGLYLVPTPLGNLEDITLRSLRLLAETDLILCEDTRITRRLLSHYGIKTKLFIYNDNSDHKVREKILSRLKDGDTLSLVSDAGMPCIADPGYRLVTLCREHNIPVYALPGPCAFVTAAATSGLPTDQLYFHGFFPRKKGEAKELIASLTPKVTHVFYESPNRLVASLQAIAATQRKMLCCVCREISKKFEEVKFAAPNELLDYYQEHKPKGEIVLLVYEQELRCISFDDLKIEITESLLQGEGVRNIARYVADQTGTTKQQAYKAILEYQKNEIKASK